MEDINKNETNKIEDPKPGTKAYLEAELASAKAELDALKTAMAAEPKGSQSMAAEPPKETGPKMVKIRIPRTKADQEDVFVSVNLSTYAIKRGVDVEVPDFVAEVLRHQEEMLENIMLFDEAHKKGD